MFVLQLATNNNEKIADWWQYMRDSSASWGSSRGVGSSRARCRLRSCQRDHLFALSSRRRRQRRQQKQQQQQKIMAATAPFYNVLCSTRAAFAACPFCVVVVWQQTISWGRHCCGFCFCWRRQRAETASATAASTKFEQQHEANWSFSCSRVAETTYLPHAGDASARQTDNAHTHNRIRVTHPRRAWHGVMKDLRRRLDLNALQMAEATA